MSVADEREDARPPVRLITRLLAEMQTSIVCAGLRAFEGDLDRFVVFTLVLRQSLMRHEAGASQPQSAAISINSLAASLGRSFETVRRHVNALVGAGLCARTRAGVVVPAMALDRVAISEAMIIAHDAFVRMVEDMPALDLPLPAARAQSVYHHQIGVNAAVDIMLAVMATNIDAHRDWLDLVLFSTVLCANVRSFAHDPARALQYADETQQVPTDLLRPVSAGTIARLLALPESTTRRHVTKLVADGRVERRGNGLVASKAWLNRPESVAISRASWDNIRRILQRAAADGFPFDDPASAYMRGRPPYVDLQLQAP